MAADDEDMPRAYALRLANRARRLIDQEHGRLAGVSGFDAADEWRDGILEAIQGLATYPNRCPVAPEDRLYVAGGVRQRLYRRGRGPTWRILFTVHETDENDPPTVYVRSVRHGSQAPMTEWPSDDQEE